MTKTPNDEQELTVNKPKKQTPKKVMELRGTGKPGSRVSVKGVLNELGKPVHADVGPDRIWVANAIAPADEGVHEISVKSSGATTSTTFEVAVPGKPKQKPRRN